MKVKKILKIFLLCLFIGIAFGILDWIVYANPMVKNLKNIYEPVSRGLIHVTANFFIDIIYGIILCVFYLLLYNSLPGYGIVKGLIYGILMWFLRIAILTFTQWMVYTTSIGAIIYMVFAGLIEMIIIGVLIGLLIRK